ncbi:hypothetical protein [Agromyces archimandritae]|uniref:Squalene cyclase n=1 Tax=Agromyces archimandritae TaxID=2781962 RepID=A0A975FKL8_9MICO|nr:hypothetical protein [Agromyces archimandritae]QTX03805.1 hypothetical protein G127AT_10780 [Agromyces archimandritae]
MDTVAWLLEAEDPSIRWQAMRDLGGSPPAEVAAERAKVATEGWGARLLALQPADGCWGGDVYGENGDRRSVTWTLHLLRRLGIDPAQAPVREAVERVRTGVHWREQEGGLPYFEGEVEACINGGVLALGAYFGVLDGADRLIDVLLSEQLDDGGWNCDAPESQRSSFDSTLCVLEGLAEFERATASTRPDVETARRRGEEYLLERNLYRRLSTGEIVLPRYANFAFPPYWTYDVLRALDYFRGTGDPPDPRIGPAIELLLHARDADGPWPAGAPWEGEVYFAVDAPEGRPSPWNTLRALRVLDWAR